jgi:hypothetical protein
MREVLAAKRRSMVADTTEAVVERWFQKGGWICGACNSQRSYSARGRT